MITIILYTLLMLVITFAFGFVVAFLIQGIGNLLFYFGGHTFGQAVHALIHMVRRETLRSRWFRRSIRNVKSESSAYLIDYHHSYGTDGNNSCKIIDYYYGNR